MQTLNYPFSQDSIFHSVNEELNKINCSLEKAIIDDQDPSIITTELHCKTRPDTLLHKFIQAIRLGLDWNDEEFQIINIITEDPEHCILTYTFEC